MVKAGAPTDAVVDEVAAALEPGDMIVDGGNAPYQDTRRREAALRDRGIHFVGTGISGGEVGALEGPSIMPGGSDESYAALAPMLETIAAQVDGTPCCTHVGPDGAGHFVKMVHNGIEYADMQLIAESYDVLRSVGGLGPAELAQVFRGWNAGELESYLIEITAQVLDHVDAATGRPFVDVVVDEAEQKGTGRWTVQSALDLGVPVTGIAEAVFARSLSGRPEQRAAAAGLPGPQDAQAAVSAGTAPAWSTTSSGRCSPRRSSPTRRGSTRSRRAATSTAGGSTAAPWPPSGGAAASSAPGSSIACARRTPPIRRCRRCSSTRPSARPWRTRRTRWRRVVATAAAAGVPTPGFASALAYYDALRRPRLPAALVQGLRDLFGAHTYRRVDRPGTFHTRWSDDGAEEER